MVGEAEPCAEKPGTCIEWLKPPRGFSLNLRLHDSFAGTISSIQPFQDVALDDGIDEARLNCLPEIKFAYGRFDAGDIVRPNAVDQVQEDESVVVRLMYELGLDLVLESWNVGRFDALGEGKFAVHESPCDGHVVA
jgi:hypothetical protein